MLQSAPIGKGPFGADVTINWCGKPEESLRPNWNRFTVEYWFTVECYMSLRASSVAFLEITEQVELM
ncbi:hypothetical protein CDL15_Pgr009473 [Punica granatum]|uniref:Uncharacterized protein n=1 Tax=Punica granatum TaxID=22663 RepID=A0A218WTJ5_PUNGR|nr:hypothetical protein CDL15_Pgr009473 [Punica granatum]